MGDFFDGWRRKAGTVALAAACVLSIAWTRSYYFSDWIIVKDVGFSLTSRLGGFDYGFNYRHETPDSVFEWIATDVAKEVWPRFREPGGIPYWSITIPLTLFSTSLLLYKPRIAKSKTNVENYTPSQPITEIRADASLEIGYNQRSNEKGNTMQYCGRVLCFFDACTCLASQRKLCPPENNASLHDK
jgi:hypothetical protein